MRTVTTTIDGDQVEVAVAAKGDHRRVTFDGEYIGYIRRPQNMVFESHNRSTWDAYLADGTKCGRAGNVDAAAAYVVTRYWRQHSIH